MEKKHSKSAKKQRNTALYPIFDDIIGASVSNIGKQIANKVTNTKTPSIPNTTKNKKK